MRPIRIASPAQSRGSRAGPEAGVLSSFHNSPSRSSHCARQLAHSKIVTASEGSRVNPRMLHAGHRSTGANTASRSRLTVYPSPADWSITAAPPRVRVRRTSARQGSMVRRSHRLGMSITLPPAGGRRRSRAAWRCRARGAAGPHPAGAPIADLTPDGGLEGRSDRRNRTESRASCPTPGAHGASRAAIARKSQRASRPAELFDQSDRVRGSGHVVVRGERHVAAAVATQIHRGDAEAGFGERGDVVAVAAAQLAQPGQADHERPVPGQLVRYLPLAAVEGAGVDLDFITAASGSLGDPVATRRIALAHRRQALAKKEEPRGGAVSGRSTGPAPSPR